MRQNVTKLVKDNETQFVTLHQEALSVLAHSVTERSDFIHFHLR